MIRVLDQAQHFVGHSGAVVSVADADSALRPLLHAIRRAVTEDRPVLVVRLWEPISLVGLLPFHIQLRWAGEIDNLPLTAAFSLIPTQHYDRALANIPLYLPDQVHDALTLARMCRKDTNTDMSKDFVWQDWEEGYCKNHSGELDGKLLPGCSYVVVGSVQSSGEPRPWSRPQLGRFAIRDAPQPQVLIPGRGADTSAALERLAEATLSIVNLQELRGLRARRTVSAFITRRTTSATLLIAACPSDILSLDQEALVGLVGLAPVVVLGQPPGLNRVTVTVVGRDRPQEQVRFDYAVTALRGHNTDMERVLDRARTAWWEARQSLQSDLATRERLLARYRQDLETFQRRNPVDAALLTTATRLLEETITDVDRARERLDAVVDVAQSHLSHSTGWRTLIIVPRGSDVDALRTAVAARFEAPWEEIQALGLDIRSIHTIRSGQRCDTLIAAGFLGPRTIDAPLFCGACEAHFVFDPVEADGARTHMDQLKAFFARVDWQEAASTLDGALAVDAVTACVGRLRDAFANAAAPARRELVSLNLGASSVALKDQLYWERVAERVGEAVETDDDFSVTGGVRVLITFTDGTSLLCPADRRLETLQDHAHRLRPVSACDVRTGDEVVLVERNSHALFSDQLMSILDEGELRHERALRDKWLLMTHLCKDRQKRSFRSIQQGLHDRGVNVHVTTVRSWIPDPEQLSNGLVPVFWRPFQALAEELDMGVSEQTLREYYVAILRWRIQHRREGRRLVRVMRYAALSQLDPQTLDWVQQLWGWKARDLMEGVRIRVVEECEVWEGSR